VLAYCKIHLYSRLLDSELPEDEHLHHDLERYFPPPLPARYGDRMGAHRLRREIIATIVANQLVDRMGTTFAFRLGEETGSSPYTLARGYAVAREVFDMRTFWAAVESLDNEVAAELQLQMLIEGRRLVERATRWLVREDFASTPIEEAVRRFESGAELLAGALPELLEGAERKTFEERAGGLRDAGVPDKLSARVAAMPWLPSVFDIVAVAEVSGRELGDVMATFFALASRLELGWLRDRIYELPRANRWQTLARAALRDDLLSAQRALTREVLESATDAASADAAIDEWVARNAAAVERCLDTLADIRASRTYDTTTLPVALREVRALIRGGDER
jgi:glutamate dehydrogenase